jgi:hypothetical protein
MLGLYQYMNTGSGCSCGAAKILISI